ELMVVWHVVENSWRVPRSREDGKRGDARPVPLPVRALAREWGVDPSNLCRARRSLVAKRVLIQSARGLLFNKNVDQWTDPATGGPLIPDARLTIAKAAQPTLKKGGNAATTPVVTSDSAPLSDLTTPVVTSDSAPLSDLTTPPRTPEEERARTGACDKTNKDSKPREQTRQTPPDGGTDCLSVSFEIARKTARDLFGEAAGEAFATSRALVEANTGGRWDCVDAAIRRLHRQQQKPNAKRIANLVGAAVALARVFAAGGIPDDVAVPAAAPARAELVYFSAASRN
ncbi:MAG: replication protein, partial [Thermoleophilia bacterium]|nr:replication protein [Thermoleophilia bacterium]